MLIDLVSRGRQGVISRRKITNNLLAAVLILTVVPPYVEFSDAALEYCFSVLSQKLLEKEVGLAFHLFLQCCLTYVLLLVQVALTAAYCAKTVILAGCSGNVLLKQYMKVLISGTIEYIASIAALSSDSQNQEETIRGVDELFKAFAGFFASIPPDKRKLLIPDFPLIILMELLVFADGRALGILLPTITLLLDPSSTATVPKSKMQALAVTQALYFARASPAAFKEATEKMDAVAKEALEASVRQALGANAAAATQAAAKPQISLKSF